MSADERAERLVRPFYLKMMRTNAIACSDEVLAAIAASGATTSDVISLHRAFWREQVMGAWLALLHDDEEVTEEVLRSLTASKGSLTAPPLATTAVVIAGRRARDALGEYLARDLRDKLGAHAFVAAAMDYLDGSEPQNRRRGFASDDFLAMLGVAERQRALRHS